MSDSANVRSIEAVERLRGALLEFGVQCTDGIDELDQVIRRVADWLDHDRPRFWKMAIRDRQRDLHQAKQELERCLMFSMQDEHPSCREERGAVRDAEQALDDAEEKAQRVRHWRQQMQQEVLEFEGRVGQLASVLADDLPHSVAALAAILKRLERYRQTRSVASPAESPWTQSAETPRSSPTRHEAKPISAGPDGAETEENSEPRSDSGTGHDDSPPSAASSHSSGKTHDDPEQTEQAH